MSEAPVKKTSKHGVVFVIFKRVAGEIVVMTQTRHVRNPAYDPLYNNTQEAIGELEEPGESVTDVILRAFQEEMGQPKDFRPVKMWGVSTQGWTIGRGDWALCHRPFCYIESLGEPQFWHNPCFAVEVPADWEPNYKKGDGEATNCNWWRIKELLKAIQCIDEYAPGLTIMGFHKPVFSAFCHLASIGEFD